MELSTPFLSSEVRFLVVLQNELERLSSTMGTRTKDFKQGRIAIEKALDSFGVKNFKVGVGPDREPLLPEGFVGSISHSRGIAVACASRKGDLIGLGIDLESLDKIRSEAVFKKISCENEFSWIVENKLEINRRGILIFSLKEAIYKAVFQAFKLKLRFKDVELSPDLIKGEASYKFFNDSHKDISLKLEFKIFDKFVLSGVSVFRLNSSYRTGITTETCRS